MPTFESVITRKGQITLPIELRRRFDLREGDRVSFEIAEDDARIIVQPLLPVHVRTYGVAPRRDTPIDLDEARREFAESRARAYEELDDESSFECDKP
jgi:AbrB family looped-hinge helix DNA binding protein